MLWCLLYCSMIRLKTLNHTEGINEHGIHTDDVKRPSTTDQCAQNRTKTDIRQIMSVTCEQL